MTKPKTTVTVEGRTLSLTNLEKVLFPGDGTTKAEVIHYYVSVAPVLLGQLRDRPVTRVRWPHGTGGPSFFEKNLPARSPAWVRSVTIESPGSRRTSERVTYPFVDSVATLVWLANLAALELHVPQWRVGADGSPRSPDRLVIDLDPGSPAGLAECAQVALLVRPALLGLGFTRVEPVTSGSKGMQLYAEPDEDALAMSQEDPGCFRNRAQALAEHLARAHPALVVASMTKTLRRGKVLLDWSQNTPAKTTISPYSIRGKGPRALVAAPRTWDELEEGAAGAGLQQLTPTQVLERLDRDGDQLEGLSGSS